MSNEINRFKNLTILVHRKSCRPYAKNQNNQPTNQPPTNRVVTLSISGCCYCCYCGCCCCFYLGDGGIFEGCMCVSTNWIIKLHFLWMAIKMNTPPANGLMCKMSTIFQHSTWSHVFESVCLGMFASCPCVDLIDWWVNEQMER